MGYQVGVTPLQMAAAVSAVANGGELVEPRVVRAVITDTRRAPVPRKSAGRPVSPGTAATLTEIMEQVTVTGTGKAARVDGYTVAGKTGTAQKVVNGGYSQSEYNASFVGFVPSRNPMFTIVVVIDSPHGRNGYYGGTVAAPIFRRIAAASLRQYGVPPSVNAAPPLLVARREEPLAKPAAGPVEMPAIVTLSAAATGSASLVPDLRGLSARDALRMLAALGMTARIQGTGVVIEQQPAPGSPIERGTHATLRLGRQAWLDAPVQQLAADTGP
jgi:membrane peptidoglycan carboxypeptidase